MTTELSIYQRMPDPLAAIQVLGAAIAKSGFFGCANESQGLVLATECMYRSKPPLALQEEYNIIFGKLSKKSEAVYSDFVRMGGMLAEISRTPELAEAELSMSGKATKRYSLSWAEAQLEPFVYVGKDDDIIAAMTAKKPLKLKGKYATPRSRMQMLWARVVSDSIRAFHPAATQGFYSPEENGDLNEGDDNGEVLNAEFEVVSEQPAAAHPDRVTDAIIKHIYSAAYEAVGKDGDAVQNYLGKLGVKQVAELTTEKGMLLIDRIKADQATKTEAAAKAKPETSSVKETDQATETQVACVKTELKKLEQAKPGTINRFSELLAASGRKRIADLTVAQCDALAIKLVAKNMDDFFTGSLQPKN